MAYEHSGDQPVYAPNSYGRGYSDVVGEVDDSWESDGPMVRQAYTLRPDDDDFSQAGTLVREVFDDEQRDRFVDNVAGHVLGGVKEQTLPKVFAYWRNVDEEIGKRIEEKVLEGGADRPGPARHRARGRPHRVLAQPAALTRPGTGVGAPAYGGDMTARPELRHANAQFVADRLLVGGDLDLFDNDKAVRQRAELVAAGVTHVVDCRHRVGRRAGLAGDRGAVRPRPDRRRGPTGAGVLVRGRGGRVLGWLEQPDSVVLTHCHMGVNRGPSLGFAVLLGLGLEPVEALRAIQAARPIAYAYYAEDAVEWWIERQGLGGAEAAAHREAFATYREQQRLDVVHVIADIRSAERDAGPASWDA